MASNRIVHIVDQDVAEKLGVNSGLIYSFIRHFCASKEAEKSKQSFHDGRYWIFNSVAGFKDLFPYLTEKQIRTALAALEDAKFIRSGVFNKQARDRTKWYTDLRVSICPQGQMDLPSGADDICPQGQTITQDTQDTTIIKNNKKEKPIDYLLTVLDAERAQAVIDHRKAKRCPLTVHAAKLLAKKFSQLPNPNDGADFMIERGHQGFEVEWMQKQSPQKQGNGKKTYREIIEGWNNERIGNGNSQNARLISADRR